MKRGLGALLVLLLVLVVAESSAAYAAGDAFAAGNSVAVDGPTTVATGVTGVTGVADVAADEGRCQSPAAAAAPTGATEKGFILGPAEVRITDVRPTDHPRLRGVHPLEVGAPATLCGVTNLRPDRNDVSVSAVRGPDANAFPVAYASTWGTDGVWEISFVVPDEVRPGRYTFDVDAGVTSERVEVEVVDPSRESDARRA